MILKKKYLTVFYKALADAKSNIDKDYISLADARIRDALATKVIFGLLHDYEEAQKKIYETFCDKNPDGTPIVEDNGGYRFAHKNKAQLELANKEMEVLNEEEVEIEISDSEKIKLFLNNTKYMPAVGEAVMIDEILADIK